MTSITAGTIFDSTKLPLTVWFPAISLITRDKIGISAMKLHRHLGISYDAAWQIRHNLIQVMMERDRVHRFSGWTELDNAYLGGERNGSEFGRCAFGKAPVVAAVKTKVQGRSLSMKAHRCRGLSETAARARQHLGTGTRDASDGLACVPGVTAAGCVYGPVVVGSGMAPAGCPES